MSRSLALWLALAAAPLGVGCEKSGSEGATGSGEAGAVQSDFAKAREDYRQEKQKDLDLLDKSIAELDAKEKVAPAKAKADLDGLLTALKAQRGAFSSDLSTLDRVAASGWESTRARLDKEWADLKAATDKAASAAVALVYRPGEMTCQDFVALADVEKPKIIYWAQGFNENGKATDSAVDVAETDKLVPAIVTECMKTPKEPLSKAIRAHPLPPHKPVASAPKPTTMTCQEFLALEDVTQPRLVYWAEGFSKDGGINDSTVDIDETDRLVPVLVKECKETPKLTFWQKVKKYF